MQEQCIYFAHANSFPSPCYRQLFSALEDSFRIDYLERIGHNQAFPVVNNWHTLRDEILSDIQEKYQQPVIGMGHSLGGVLIFLAACLMPQLFHHIILLDSPVYGLLKGIMLRLSKWFNQVEYLTPAARTKNRRTSWPDKASALAYFQQKSLFSHFDPACLQDYVDYGLEPGGKGWQLYFERDIEYKIYKTLPDNLAVYRRFQRPPTTLIYGNHSYLFKAGNIRYMQTKLGFGTEVIEGGHLFPFEVPVKTAELIKHIVKS